MPYGEAIVDKHSTSEEMSYKFNAKELDEETGLYYYGARYLDPMSAMWLSVDPLFEKYVGMSPYVYCAGNPVKFIDPDGCDPTKDEAAAMSAHVYGDIGDDGLKGGWIVSKRVKESRKFKYSEESGKGFKSQLYERTVDGKTEYCYATAGTDDMNDCAEDAAQASGLGILTQYSQSIKNAKFLKEELEGSDLSFTGHSLGGGLAIANALATGCSAYTFNPAGLQAFSLFEFAAFYGCTNFDANIHNYIMAGDPLNIANCILPFTLRIGKSHYLFHYGYGIGGHSIDEFQKGTYPLKNLMFDSYCRFTEKFKNLCMPKISF